MVGSPRRLSNKTQAAGAEKALSYGREASKGVAFCMGLPSGLHLTLRQGLKLPFMLPLHPSPSGFLDD